MLDWELEDRSTAEWDEGARPYLVTFLTAHTPYARVLSLVGTPSKKQVKLALTRQGYPSWTEEDFQRLLFTLGCVGYGWLQPEGVRRELEKMTANWLSSPALPKRSIGSWLWSLLTSPLLDLRP
jgi:hypothetical protein